VISQNPPKLNGFPRPCHIAYYYRPNEGRLPSRREVTGTGMTKIISTFNNLTLSDIETVGEYNIKLVAANPFLDNRGHDCKLMVTRR
jgi:hypothetical protein